MRNLIIVLAVLMNLNMYAQENNKRIELHSISISPANIYLNNRNGGFGMSLDLGFNMRNHIFKFYFGGATEYTITILGDPIKDSYEEYNLLYGREFSVKKWFGIDLFTGVGYFNFHFDKGSSQGYKKGVFGIPLQSKIRFKTGRVFSLGMQLHGNINSASTIFQPGIFLQWKL